MVAKKSEDVVAVPATSPEINWVTVDSWDAAVNAFPTIIPASVAFGDGSTMIENKKTLIGMEFIVLDWRFVVDSATNREYVNVLIMNRTGDKGRFNDGSTGIAEQCRQYEEAFGRRGGIHCQRGLRVSEYNYTNEKGEVSLARTFYFDN